MRRQKHVNGSRHGMTLLEVIVATALFVGGMAIIGQLLRLGLLTAESNKRTTQGLLRAESKMEELVLGIEGLAAEGPVSFEDDERWRWSIVSASTPVEGLIRLELKVEHLRSEDQEEELDFEYRLNRWMVAPEFRSPPWEEASPGGTPTPMTVREMLGLPRSNARLSSGVTSASPPSR